ncbi:hypothetical protein BC835DRAFT_1519199 [Cytidiella melzeri]|nr:hypothetical protein BC835DRAFT_1519199 [Cytidiella melzeri]
MSILHLPYDDSAFMHQRGSTSYDMGTTIDMRTSSFLPEQYLFDQMLHPLASMSASQSMPYDIPHGFAPSHYHLSSVPYELHNLGNSHHQPPSSLDWTETTPRTHYPEPPSSSTQVFPSTSISQPSIFVSPSSHSVAPTATPATAQLSAPPPPPWTMSGSLDPSTGIYQIAPEHPRIRTAQACEKCRGRKAKCSGEHPACERCRVRGLRCEYAPERKMRGPNKVKRKVVDQSRKDSRRISVASTSSEASTLSFASSDASAADLLTPTAAASDSRPSSASSSSASSPNGSPGIQVVHTPAARRLGRPRPGHIDLSGTKLYDQIPLSFVPQDDTFAYDVNPSRRSSLPSSLADSFSNQSLGRSPSLGQVYTPSRELDVIDASIQRPRSNPIQLHHSFHMPLAHEAFSRSGSDLSMSAPLTPLSMRPSGAGLMYPMDFPADSLDFSGLDSHLDMTNVDAWDSVGADINITPRVTTDGHEKSFASFESQFIHN